MDYILTSADKRELQDAYLTRYRSGEIGPVTFRALCRKTGMDNDDITALIRQYIDDNAEGFKAQLAGGYCSGGKD